MNKACFSHNVIYINKYRHFRIDDSRIWIHRQKVLTKICDFSGTVLGTAKEEPRDQLSISWSYQVNFIVSYATQWVVNHAFQKKKMFSECMKRGGDRSLSAGSTKLYFIQGRTSSGWCPTASRVWSADFSVGVTILPLLSLDYLINWLTDSLIT